MDVYNTRQFKVKNTWLHLALKKNIYQTFSLTFIFGLEVFSNTCIHSQVVCRKTVRFWKFQNDFYKFEIIWIKINMHQKGRVRHVINLKAYSSMATQNVWQWRIVSLDLRKDSPAIRLLQCIYLFMVFTKHRITYFILTLFVTTTFNHTFFTLLAYICCG